MDKTKLNPFQQYLYDYAKKINKLKMDKCVGPIYAITAEEKLCAIIVKLYEMNTMLITPETIKEEVRESIDKNIVPYEIGIMVVKPFMITDNSNDHTLIIDECNEYHIGDITTVQNMYKLFPEINTILMEYMHEYDRYRLSDDHPIGDVIKAYPE